MIFNKINNEEREMADNKINIEGLGETVVGDVGGPLRRQVPPGCRPASWEALSVFVAGRPAPQGSKTYLGRRGGRGVLVESSKAVKPWRADVRQAFLGEPTRDVYGDWYETPLRRFEGALVVMIVFVMPRPASTPKTRATPPAVKRPDLDKLVRAVLDAVGSAGVWTDDSQVITVHAHKRVAELGEPTGAMIHIEHACVSCFDLQPSSDLG